MPIPIYIRVLTKAKSFACVIFAVLLKPKTKLPECGRRVGFCNVVVCALWVHGFLGFGATLVQASPKPVEGITQATSVVGTPTQVQPPDWAVFDWVELPHRPPAPNFGAPRFLGPSVKDKASTRPRNIALTQFKGQPILLNFWATWCKPCVVELPDLVALNQHFGQAQNIPLQKNKPYQQGQQPAKKPALQVVLMSVDRGASTKVQQFLDRLGVGLLGGHDQNGQISQRYGVEGLPFSVLIDGQGRVLALAHGARRWNTKAAQKRIRAILP